MTDAQTEHKQSRRGEIVIAIIGLVGVIVTAAFSNWDKLFGHQPPSEPVQHTAPPPAFPIFINGSVIDARGNKLKEVLIQLFDVGSGKQVGSTVKTDRNGSFTLQIQSSDLQNKLLRVSAQKGNMEPAETVQLGHDQYRLSIVLSDQRESP